MPFNAKSRKGMSLHNAEYKKFIKLLKKQRLEKKISQMELSKRLGKTQQYVSRCEVGERRLDLVELSEWCDALDTDALALYADLLNILSKRKKIQQVLGEGTASDEDTCTPLRADEA